MGLMKKFDVVRDIQMMVRKGAFQFEEKDRPVVYLYGRGEDSPVAARVGGVEFDEERQRLVFSAYDMEGRFMPRADGESRDLGILSARSLVAVKETVERYFEWSLNRARNVEMIYSEVRGNMDGNLNLVFPGEKPVVSFEDASGRNRKVTVGELFFPEQANEANIFFSGVDSAGARVNGRLFELNDVCVQNIANLLSDGQRQALGAERAEKRERSVQAGKSMGITF